MRAHRDRVHRGLPSLRRLSPRRLYLDWLWAQERRRLRSRPRPVPPTRTSVATMRDRDGHAARASTWDDGSLTIDGVIDPSSSWDGERYEYSFCVKVGDARGLVDGLGSPRWTELVTVLAASADEILDHGHTPLAEVLMVQSFGRENLLTAGGPGSWLAGRGVSFCYRIGYGPAPDPAFPTGVQGIPLRPAEYTSWHVSPPPSAPLGE